MAARRGPANETGLPDGCHAKKEPTPLVIVGAVSREEDRR